MSNGNSLPNYLVNLDEMSDAINQIYENAEVVNDIDTVIQRSQGFFIKSEDYGIETAEWKIPFDLEITGVDYSQDDVRNLGYDDYINIYLNNELVLETVFLKEMAESKEFLATIKAKENDLLLIEYINDTGIEKEFKIDVNYLNRVDMDMSPQPVPDPIIPEEPPVEPEEPEIPIDPEYIYKFNLRWQGSVRTDLDLYASMFNETNGSDISPSKTVGFSQRSYTVDNDNKVVMTAVVEDHIASDSRLTKPETILVYGKPSNYIRLYVRVYSYGEQITENVNLEIIKKDGTVETLLADLVKAPNRFNVNGTRVYYCDFNLNTEGIREY